MATALPRLGPGPRVDGVPVADVRRTHSAELWFHGDLVVKRKLAVDLGFLDFTTLAARRRACHAEVALNRRLSDDVYLGVQDVVDAAGAVVDVAVVMRRLDAGRRLSTLAARGDGLDEEVRQVARRVAAFHAGLPAAADGAELAGPSALATNWADNLAVLSQHPDRVDPDDVASVRSLVDPWLAGRADLLDARVRSGMVRDGHGDLRAEDVFLLDDGPRILDCLDFARRYRVGDVLLDIAFLVMELELGERPDLARLLLRTWASFTGEHHPSGLAHHYVAYRAGVRAKVACLVADSDEDPSVLLRSARRHLQEAEVRLVLVGGLPGTGKSTIAARLSDALGMVLLRSDELRKDLVGVAHGQPASTSAYRPAVTAATYASLLARADHLLRDGESVVLDATWADADHRAAAAALADATSSRLVSLRCVLPTAVAHRRLALRRGDVSDADAAIHDTMSSRFEPWPEATRLHTDAPPEQVLVAALGAVERWDLGGADG